MRHPIILFSGHAIVLALVDISAGSVLQPLCCRRARAEVSQKCYIKVCVCVYANIVKYIVLICPTCRQTIEDILLSVDPGFKVSLCSFSSRATVKWLPGQTTMQPLKRLF